MGDEPNTLILRGTHARVEMHLRPFSIWRAVSCPEFLVRWNRYCFERLDPVTGAWGAAGPASLVYEDIEFEMVRC